MSPSFLSSVAKLIGFGMFASATFMCGQAGLGSINGIVSDSSGLAVPTATITLASESTGLQRVVSSSNIGYYTIPSLQPGTYSLTVEKPGFAISTRRDIPLDVQQNLTVDITVGVRALTQTVSATTAPPVLEATDATIGQVINSAQTVGLPLNGRQFSQLILLAPGAAPRGGAQQGAFTVQIGGGGISPAVNGQSGNFNNFTMDGLDNNSRFANVWAVAPPPDAIQEFKLETGQYAGPNVNIATKPGTDDFHGSIWEFFRNDKLDARNTFDVTKPPYRQNQYGLFFGAPVYIPKLMNGRNTHTWVSAYWEGFKSRRSRTYFSTVPIAAMLNGDFSYFLGKQIGSDSLLRPILSGQIYNPLTTRPDPANPGQYLRDPYVGNMLPQSQINPIALQYLSHYYSPANLGVFPNNLIWAQSTATDSDQYGIRLDQRIGLSDSFFVRGNVPNATATQPGGLPTNPQFLSNETRTIGGGYTHIVTPSLVSDTVFGYTRDYTPDYTAGVSREFQQELGMSQFLPPFQGNIFIPQSISLSPQFSGVNERGWYLGGPDYSYNLNTGITKVAGNHSIHANVTMLKWRHIGQPQPSFNETFTQLSTALPTSTASTGQSLASFLLGLPTNTFNFIIPYKNIDGTVWDLSVGDSWKLTKRLTLNVGLGWDHRTGPHFYRNQVSIFDLSTGQWRWAATNPITGQPPNLPSSVYNPQWKEFAPQAGIAYQVTSRTVIRTGYSLYYDHNNSLIQGQQELLGNYPFGGRPGVTNANVNLLSGITFTNPIPSGLTGISPLTSPGFTANTNNRTPYVEQGNFGVQQEVASGTVLSVDFVSSEGRDLFMHLTANMATVPGPGPLGPRQPFPQFGTFTLDATEGESDYNSLQVKVDKRFSHGFTVLGSYTFSKALGTVSGPQEGQVVNTYDIRDSRGPLSYDVHNALVLSAVVELPFGYKRHWLSSSGRFVSAIAGGWNVSGIYSAYSGFPLTPVISFDDANTGASNERPEIIGNPFPAGFNQSRQAWINAAAFAIPAQYTYGNAGVGILRGPGILNLDFSAYKNFRFAESKTLEFRFESFNVLNDTNLDAPNLTVGSLAFGTITGAADPRDIQLALKFLW